MKNDPFFADGTPVQEPPTDTRPLWFIKKRSLYEHVIIHVFVQKCERWHDVGIIDRNRYAQIQKVDAISNSIQIYSSIRRSKFTQACDIQQQERRQNKTGGKKPWDNKRGKQYDSPEKKNNVEYSGKSIPVDDKTWNQLRLQLENVPEFVNLSKEYLSLLSKLLVQGCNGASPHYHYLKTKQENSFEDEDENAQTRRSAIQTIVLLDPDTGILVCAKYDNFTHGSQVLYEFRISTGYRLYPGEDKEKRIREFQTKKKQMQILEENKHDRQYRLDDSVRHNIDQ